MNLTKIAAYVAVLASLALTACQTPVKKAVACKPHISPIMTSIAPRQVDTRVSHEWGKPYKIDVWRTAYSHDESDADCGTQHGETSGCIPLIYGNSSTIGIVSAPKRFPRGSIVEIPTYNGPMRFLLADSGSAVESGKAAKISGLTKKQKKTPVFDFFLEKDLWNTKSPGPLAQATIYPYKGGTKAFTALTGAQRKDLQFVAQVKVATLADHRAVAKQ